MHKLIEAYSLFFSSSAVTDVDADVAFQMIHTEISLFHLFNTAYKLLFLLLLLLLILACYIVMALSQDAYVCVCGEGLIFCSGPPRPHPRCGTRPCHRSLPRSRCVHAWSPRARLHRDTETVLEESIQTHTSNLITYNTLALPDWTFPRPNGGKYNHTNYFTAIILHTYIY